MLNAIKKIFKTVVSICGHRPVKVQIGIVSPDEVLKNKAVLITGGTSGIGKAMAELFYKSGAFVVITSRSEARAVATARSIDCEGKSVIGVGLDNTRVDNYSDKIDNIAGLTPNGVIDILVNNAGIVGGDIRTTDEEEFDKIISTNLKGVFFLSKAVATHMVKNKVKGNILNIASSSSRRPAILAYTLSKWGIRGLTEGLAKMLVSHDIVVNGLAPGPTATPMLGKDSNSDVGHDSSLIGRYALPEEIASMALFLVSSSGRTIIGDIVYMTGGAGVIDNNDIDYTFEI